ncbi:MAG TPA: hypothetical protein VFS05_03055 [Gemmatimonadaceae bacterium]|nr:hypothetical protein [Gemmatimonadaceae bacterium]
MDRTVYIPNISDHSHGVAAAMRAYGIPAEVLPPPDAETLAIGLDLCRGRECLPCFLCTGDIIRRSRRPGFDPARAVYFMPTGPGPCRFGQYRVLEREILDRMGLEAVEVTSPSTDTSYALFAENVTAVRKLAWQGLVAVDLLQKARHELRPYELERGLTDEAYALALAGLAAGIEARRDAGALAAMEAAARLFEAVPVDRFVRRPIIAVLGELFVLLNTYSNSALVRDVEAAGGEVLQGTFSDWLYYVDTNRAYWDRRQGLWGDFVKAALSDRYQRAQEARLRRPLARILTHPPEATPREAMKLLAPHYDPKLGTEAVLTMSRALDVARHGIGGILNILPFSCMPGTVVSGMAPKLREAMGGVPWLDLSYDGQETTNIRTRLEAFMHQVFQFERRRAPIDHQRAGV